MFHIPVDVPVPSRKRKTIQLAPTSAGTEAPPMVPVVPEVGVQVALEGEREALKEATPPGTDAAKEGGGEVVAKTGGHEGVVDPPAVDLASSSQDASEGLPQLEVTLQSKKPVEPAKEASVASASGTAISGELATAFDGAEGMLG